jgi:hypothetical protein
MGFNALKTVCYCHTAAALFEVVNLLLVHGTDANAMIICDGTRFLR